METDEELFKCEFENISGNEEFKINWTISNLGSVENETVAYVNSPFVKSRLEDDCMHYWSLYLKKKEDGTTHFYIAQFLRCYKEVAMDIRCDMTLKSVNRGLEEGILIIGVVDGYQGPFGTFPLRERRNPDADDSLMIKMNVYAQRKRPLTDQDTRTGQNLGKLRENGLWSDLEVISAGRAFHVHRAILAARSPVFSAMLTSHFTEGQNCRIELEDSSPEAVEQFLHYIYTGEIDTAHTEDLLVLADKYCMQELKDECCAKLWLEVTDETALRSLALAERHSCSRLQEKLIRFVCSHPAARVQKSPDLENMSKEQLLKLIKRIKLPK